MRLLKYFIVFAIIVNFSGCDILRKSNFEKIQIGMGKNEVEEILGKDEYGNYESKEAYIFIKYDDDKKVISKSYIIKDKDIDSESILEGYISVIASFNMGDRYATASGVSLNNYKVITTKNTQYIDSENNNKPFYLSVGQLYVVYGNLEVGGKEIIVSKICKTKRKGEIDPKTAEEYIKRGHTRVKFTDYQGALSDYTKAIEMDTNNFDAFCSRGYTNQMLGNGKIALDDYTRAIQIKPTDTLAFLSRAYVKSELKDREGAKLDLEKAASFGSLSAKEYLNKYFDKSPKR